MASWIHVTCEFLSWFTFVIWVSSYYPQIIMNFLRKSVEGLSIDFVLFNFSTHTMYLVFDTSLFFSPPVQQQYKNIHNLRARIFAVATGFVFSIHAVLLTATTLFQTAIYERGNQKVSAHTWNLVFVSWAVVGGFFFMALPQHLWLFFLLMFNGILIGMDVITYVPQAWMNYKRKSTEGWNIWTILLELLGHVVNFTQLALIAIDKGPRTMLGEIDWQSIILSLVTVAFDIIFIVQHFILYAPKDDLETPSPPPAEAENADGTETENV